MQSLNTQSVLDRTFGHLAFKFALVAVFVASVLANTAPLVPLAFAQSEKEKEKAKSQCSEVGGAFVTNFIASDQTAGTATGDLKGALGVKVLAVVSGEIGTGTLVVLKVQHFWVTEAGDTLFLAE